MLASPILMPLLAQLAFAGNNAAPTEFHSR